MTNEEFARVVSYMAGACFGWVADALTPGFEGKEITLQERHNFCVAMQAYLERIDVTAEESER